MNFNFFDFDNTLYYNKKNDFTENINLNNFSNFTFEFDNSINFLITGRHESQKQQILHSCRLKGYVFKESYFLQFPQYIYQRNDFMDIYRDWKLDTIISLLNLFCDDLIFENCFCKIFEDDKEIVMKLITRLEQEELDQKRVLLRLVRLSKMPNGEITKNIISVR